MLHITHVEYLKAGMWIQGSWQQPVFWSKVQTDLLHICIYAHIDLYAEMPWDVYRYIAHNIYLCIYRYEMYVNYNHHFVAIFHMHYFMVLWTYFYVDHLVSQDKEFYFIFIFNVSTNVCKKFIKWLLSITKVLAKKWRL